MRAILQNIVAALVGASGLAALAGWLCQTAISPDENVSRDTFALVIAAATFVFSFFIVLLVSAFPKSRFHRPKVVLFKIDDQYEDGLFVFAPTEWLVYGSAYSVIIIEEDKFERIIAIGRVLIIQDDKKVQLIVEQKANGGAHIWSELSSNAKDTLKRVTLKPGAPANV